MADKMEDEKPDPRLQRQEELQAKFSWVPDADPSSGTVTLQEEDHTIGNTVRYMLMRNPKVEFAGYSIPHPSDKMINIRLQTFGSNPIDELKKSLTDLKSVCSHLLDVVEMEIPEL